jgi:hypothetical protein
MIIAHITRFLRTIGEIIRDARAMQREMHRKHGPATE